MAGPPRNEPSVALAPCSRCGRSFAADVLTCERDGVMLPLEGRLLDGKFSLDRKIGDGGMASVWQATNVRVARTVAIKLMHGRFASDPELLARFRNEAAAAGKIGSEHICDVLDFGESPIGPYIVMELLDGCSLAELCGQHRKLDPGLAVWIVRQALAGLAAAHRAGIVHRDLKPENIHLCRAIRGQWTVKLMDFGISKFAQDPNTAAGATLGTPHYMAPEQIQGASKVDARADLWSIGVILYEAVTGVQLFARDNVAAALVALRSYDPPPLTQYLPDAPRGLAEVVARCLVRAPDKRVPSAEALAEALKPFERIGPKSAETATKAATERRAAGNPRALAQAVAPVQVQPARAGQQPARTGQQPVVPAQAGRAPQSVQPQRTGQQPVVPAQAGRAPQSVQANPSAQPLRAAQPVQPTQPLQPLRPAQPQQPAQPLRAAQPVQAVAAGKLPQPGLLDRSGPPSSRAGKLPMPGSQRTGAQAPIAAVRPQPAVPVAQAAGAPQRTVAPDPRRPAAATGQNADMMPTVPRPMMIKRGVAPPKRGIAATPANRALLIGVVLAVLGLGLVLVVVLATR